MSDSNTQSQTAPVFLKILRFVGIYLLSIAITYFLGKMGFFLNVKLNPVFFLVYAFIALPLVWALSKNFFAGFIKYVLMIGIVMFIGWVSSKNVDGSNDSSKSSLSYVGNYSADENGVQVKIIVSTDNWYGEVIEGNTGGLISNESGQINGNKLLDQYRNEVGEISNGEIRMSIKGQQVRLKKD